MCSQRCFFFTGFLNESGCTKKYVLSSFVLKEILLKYAKMSSLSFKAAPVDL
jgi:hypothetical protein